MLTWIGQLMNSRNFTPFTVDDVSHWQNAMEEVTREDNHGTDYNHFLLEGFSRGEQLFPGQLSANVAWYMDVIGDDNSRGVFVQIDLAGSGAQVKVWQNSMLSPWRDIAISDDFRAQVEQNTRDIENLYQELAEAVEHAEAYTDEKLVEAKAYTDQQIDASMAEVREITDEAKQIATEAAQTASEARDIATDARHSADDAYTAALQAEFSAEAANASANQAAQSAAEAQRQAESAESQVEVARAAAEAAQASAEHAEEVAINKTEKKLLSYNGANILAPDGSILTFAQLYNWLMNDPYFVVLVYNNYAYHPNGVSTSQIVFSSEFPVNSYDRAHRITMLSSGVITMTETESEHTISRVSVISDANKGSTVQYTSVKAVADYVDPVKENVAQLNGRMSAIEERVDNIDEVIIQTVEPLQKQADNTDRKLDALWKLSEGQVYDIQQQNESGMNIASSGAKYVAVSEVYGKTEQNSTNGYQLIPFTSVSSEPVTKEGITFTPVFDEDGILLYVEGNGTSTGRAQYDLCGNIYLDDGEYTLSQGTPVNVLGGATAFVRYVKTSGGTDYIDIGQNAGIEHVTRNITDVNIIQAIIIEVRVSGVTLDHFRWYPMLEKGSTAHSYEPFTGGFPAPNPDFPQGVKSVESFTLKSVGKNLFNYKTDYEHTQYNYFVDNGDGTFTTGGIGGLHKFATLEFSPGTYTASIQPCAGYDLGSMYVRERDSTNITPSYTFSVTNRENKTFYIRAYEGDIVKFTFSVEAGNTATPYEAYTEQTRTITPPHPLNKIGSYTDVCDVDDGVWKYALTSRTFAELPGNAREIGIGDVMYISFSAMMDVMQARIGMLTALSTHHRIANIYSNNTDYGLCIGAEEPPQMRVRCGKSIAEYRQILLANPMTVVATLIEPVTEPISADDLEFLRSLSLTPTDHHITITDQNGEDVSWLAEYIIKLSEV